MLGVGVEGSSFLFGENMSVVQNTSIPSSTLNKKHCAIAYHKVREAIAAGIVKIAYVPSEENIADIFTKPLGNQAFYRL